MESRRSDKKKRRLEWIISSLRRGKDNSKSSGNRFQKYLNSQKRSSMSKINLITKRKRLRCSQVSLKTLKSILRKESFKAKMPIQKHSRPKFKFSRRDSIIKRSRFWRKSSSTKRSPNWLKSLELPPWMVEKALWRSPKRSTNTKRGQLNSQEKCLQLFLNSPCSRVRLWNSSKRKKKKISYWSKPFREWKTVCHQQIVPTQSGKRRSETTTEGRPRESKGFKESN